MGLIHAVVAAVRLLNHMQSPPICKSDGTMHCIGSVNSVGEGSMNRASVKRNCPIPETRPTNPSRSRDSSC